VITLLKIGNRYFKNENEINEKDFAILTNTLTTDRSIIMADKEHGIYIKQFDRKEI
jgi:hypothetical protein